MSQSKFRHQKRSEEVGKRKSRSRREKDQLARTKTLLNIQHSNQEKQNKTTSTFSRRPQKEQPEKQTQERDTHDKQPRANPRQIVYSHHEQSCHCVAIQRDKDKGTR
jgi:hypothetical protein